MAKSMPRKKAKKQQIKQTRQTKQTMRGQANPQDSATSVFWDVNEAFSELFNKVVFKRDLVNPKTLKDAREVESTWVRLSKKAGFFLKNTRDNCKESDEVGLLAILGVENMTTIDYQMAFRGMLLDVINYGRQISIIETKHRAEEQALPKEQRPKITGGEYLGKFRKDDRLKRAITLVVYYGKEPWDGPTRLYDMIENPPNVDWGEGYPNGDYPMYLLDVKRMSEELLNQFSPQLRAFLGFLKYEGTRTSDLHNFVLENDDVFKSAPPITMNALVELTGSKELEKYMKEFPTPEGGTNVCAGIQYTAEMSSKRTFVDAAKRFNQTLADTIKAYIDEFKTKPDEAEKEVKELWGN